MEFELWVILAIIGSVIFGLFGAIELLMFIFAPDDFREQWMSRKKIRIVHEHAKSIAKQYNIPLPPELYCPVCGEELRWDYVSDRVAL
jgi:hypothetical protein